MKYVCHYSSPVGILRLESDGKALTGLWFTDQSSTQEDILPIFDETIRWLDIYFSGKDPGYTPKLAPEGTAFRKAVWDILLTIPYGKTMSYGQIAKQIAEEKGIARMSSQAVGGAVGHNPIAIIIPCHRVIGSDGSLTGYGGGLDRKIRLLELEGVIQTQRPPKQFQ